MRIFITFFFLYIPLTVFSQVESIFEESNWFQPGFFVKVDNSIYFNYKGKYASANPPGGIYSFNPNSIFPASMESILAAQDIFVELNQPTYFQSIEKVDNYIYYEYFSSGLSGFSRFNIMDPINSNEHIFEAEEGVINYTAAPGIAILGDTIYFNYSDSDFNSRVGKIDVNSANNDLTEETSVNFMYKMKSLNNNTILYLKDVDNSNYSQHYAIYQFDPNNTTEPHQELFLNQSHSIHGFDIVNMNLYFTIFNNQCNPHCVELYSINLDQTPLNAELVSYIPSYGEYDFSIIDNYIYFSEITNGSDGQSEVRRLDLTNPILSINDFSQTNNKMMVSPNPSDGFIRISNTPYLTDYEIFNINGSLISRGKYKTNETIDTKGLKNGIYFIRLNNKTLKFIVN